MTRSALVASAIAAAAVVAQPPLGPLDGVAPIQALTMGLRHCNYVASVTPPDGSQDFSFIVVDALNGNPSARSLQSVNYPTYYLTIQNTSTGAVGIAPTPDVNDASWSFDTPLAPPPNGATDVYSVQSLSKNSAWTGKYVTFTTANNAPCKYSSPSGDVMLTDGNGIAPGRLTWVFGALPPLNTTSVTVNGGVVTNPRVNKRFMGCHR